MTTCPMLCPVGVTDRYMSYNYEPKFWALGAYFLEPYFHSHFKIINNKKPNFIITFDNTRSVGLIF